jgi:hypothetical protein
MRVEGVYPMVSVYRQRSSGKSVPELKAALTDGPRKCGGLMMSV